MWLCVYFSIFWAAGAGNEEGWGGGVEQDLALGVLAVRWGGGVLESTRCGMRPAAPRVSVGATATPGNPLPPPPSVFKQEKKKKKAGKKTQQTKKTNT